MIIGIDHIGVAVRKLDEAVALYRDVLGLKLEGISRVDEDRVRVAFFSADGGTKIELIEPTESESTIARFIEKRGEGIHHISLRVENIGAILEGLKKKGLRLIDDKPRTGAEGDVAFIHPSSTRRVLYELCEKP